jgi:methylated-DNA-protein-cysteine methyltransferase-like protein
VTKVVKAIPRGEVLSYSQVALRAGMPGNPRGVVRALKLAKDLPWWRVLRADRTLAPQVASEQARRLRAEGVTVRGRRVIVAAPVPKSASTRAAMRRHPLPSPRPSPGGRGDRNQSKR